MVLLSVIDNGHVKIKHACDYFLKLSVGLLVKQKSMSNSRTTDVIDGVVYGYTDNIDCTRSKRGYCDVEFSNSYGKCTVAPAKLTHERIVFYHKKQDITHTASIRSRRVYVQKTDSPD